MNRNGALVRRAAMLVALCLGFGVCGVGWTEEGAASPAAAGALPLVAYGGTYFRGEAQKVAEHFPLLARVAGIGLNGAVDEKKNAAFRARWTALFTDNAAKITRFKLVIAGADDGKAGVLTSSLGKTERALSLFFDGENTIQETITVGRATHLKLQYILTGSLTIYDFSKMKQSGELFIVSSFPVFFTAVTYLDNPADLTGEKGEAFLRKALFDLTGATMAGKELAEGLEQNGGLPRVRCDLASQLTGSLFPKLYCGIAGTGEHLQVREIFIGKQAQEPANLGERYSRDPDQFRLLIAQRISASLTAHLGVSVLPPQLAQAADGKEKTTGQEANLAMEKTSYAGLGEVRYAPATYQVFYRLRGVVKQAQAQPEGGTQVVFGGYSVLKIAVQDRLLWQETYNSALADQIPAGMSTQTNDADWFTVLTFQAAHEGVMKMNLGDPRLSDLLFGSKVYKDN